MKGTSPYLVFSAYLATVLVFEILVRSSLTTLGLSAYRSEKISMLLAAGLLIATHKLHFYQGQPKHSFKKPDFLQIKQALLFSVLLGAAGIALIGVQVFLTAQFFQQTAATLWNFTGNPGELGFHDRYFGSKSGPINLALFFSTQCIVLPLAEEIYFKGIILEKLLSKHSVLASILITSTLFTVAHDSRTYISVFAFSVLSCLYYQYCRNIWILAGIHGFGNFYDWLYSGFGGITFLEAKRVDELGNLSTWGVELIIAVLFCTACCLFLFKISSKVPPSPSPASSSPDPDPT